MPHFFDKRDRWGNSPAIWIVVGMVFLIPISLWSLGSIRLENDVPSWIPKDNPEALAVDWFRGHFPPEEVLLFTWEGSSIDDPRVERLVQRIRGTADSTGKLRGGSKLIDRICTPQELIAQMRENKVSRAEALRRLEGVLVGSGPLRIRLTEYGRDRRDKVVETLRLAARETLHIELETSVPDSDGMDFSTGAASSDTEGAGEAAAGQQPAVAHTTNESNPVLDSNGESAPVTDSEAGHEAAGLAPHHLIVAWRGMHWNAATLASFKELALNLRLTTNRSREASPAIVEDCFQVPGAPIALAVSLSEAGRADREAAFHCLSTAAEEAGIPPESIHMGGSSVAGAALNREVMKSVWDRSAPAYQIHRRSIILLSGLAGGLLAFWLLKNFRLAGLVLGVSFYATLVSTGLVPATGGAMNMVLVVMPTLILVTTLSVAIHVANDWQHAAAVNLKTAVVEAARTAHVPCLWAGVTAAIGQASLMTSSLAPVRDFGLYSALGTVISLAATLYGLPALLQLWPGRAPRNEDLGSAFWQALASWLAARHKPVMVVSLLACAACLWGLKSFKTDARVISYFSPNTRTIQDYQFIEDRIAGVIPVDVIVRFDRETQQQLKFLKRRDLVQKIENELESLSDISGALSLADFLPSVPAPSDHAHLRERSQYNQSSRTIEARVKGGEHGAARSLLAVAGDATQFNAEGDELWRITAQVGILSNRNYQELRREIDEICSSVLRIASGDAPEKLPPAGKQRRYHPGASHVVTGEIPLFVATQQELLDSFIWSFVGAFAIIALVVMIVLRHPIAGILAMLPNALPIAAVFGLISWCGVQVDIASAVTASIALGITIDGTLHLITWFRLGILQGKNRAEAVSLALAHCGPAVWQTTLVVSVGLVMLCPSELILISRFGWLMAALLAAASISDLVLTPALLAGPLGQIIERCATAPTRSPAEADHAALKSEQRLPEIASSVPSKPHIAKKSVRIRRAD